MNIRHKEIEIETSNPFKNCKLDRKQYSDVLTGIIDEYQEGFVLAINNKWGTGKTTFIKMWEQELKNNDYNTVYFNAWENDFENNPLVALMGELKTLTKKSTDPKFNKVLKKAAILTKHAIPIVAQAVVDRYVNTKEVKDAIVEVTKGIADVFENDVNEYAAKKKGIIEFRKSLAEFIANTSNGKSFIFIIDELDRCRPNYAVSILEQIKHFFTVPNIVFVLSIDKEQLGNAVRGVYGSDKIDADEYLKRFIDIEYSIPEPDSQAFYKYLYEYFGFDDFLGNTNRASSYEFGDDKSLFFKTCKILFSNEAITLRQQEKIFSHSRLSLRSFKEAMYLIPEVFLFLIYIKVIDEQFYNNLKSKRLTVQELQQNFLSIVKNSINADNENTLMWLEAYLILYYNNYINKPYRLNNIFEYDSTLNKNILLVTSIINENKNEHFLKIFEHMNNRRVNENLDFSHFFKRINLTEPLVS